MLVGAAWWAGRAGGQVHINVGWTEIVLAVLVARLFFGIWVDWANVSWGLVLVGYRAAMNALTGYE